MRRRHFSLVLLCETIQSLFGTKLSPKSWDICDHYQIDKCVSKTDSVVFVLGYSFDFPLKFIHKTAVEKPSNRSRPVVKIWE